MLFFHKSKGVGKMEKQSPQVIERNQYWYSKLLRSVFEDIKNLNYALIKGDILIAVLGLLKIASTNLS